MKLLYKTILIALAVIAVFSAALYFLSSAFIARSYDKLESDTVIKDLQRVKYAIDDRLKALEKSAADWAVWDDSYNFIQDQNQSYIDLTLSDVALVNAGFNFIAYYDLTDRLLFSKFLDLNTLKSIPLTEVDIRQVNAFYHSQDNYLVSGVSGIVELSYGALMVASYPVLHSDSTGPVDGVLLHGRLLNTNEIKSISHSTQLVLSVQPYVDLDMRGLSGESLSPLIMNGDYFISKTNLESLNAYKIINDYKDQPCLIVQTIISRDIFNEGRDTIYWIHAVLLTLSIVFVVMTSILIYLMIISRVKKLTSGLQRVSEKNDLTIRMPVIGNDEISTLTRQTNSTLDKIAKTQFELKSSEDRFRKISEVAQDLIYQFALQPELVIEYISPSVEKILGYSVTEVTRDSSWLLKTIYAEDREKFIGLLNQPTLTSKKGMVLRWIHKDGHLVWVEHANSVIDDELGKPIRIIGVGRNISERISMESNLVELYQKEKETRQEFEKENKARAFFIDVLGHELKTPMTPLLLSLDILQDKTDPNLTPLQNKLINNAVESVKLLSARLDELLDLARFARGTFRLESQVFDIKEYLESAISRFQPALESRRQRLNIQISPELARIKADPFRLEQVISNLLSNASKYSDEDQEIYFRARNMGGVLEVEVEDRGVGISLEEQGRLFEPYHRVEQDRQRFSGLGLGLAVSRQIVEAHGGRLTVTSETGHGSIFKFTIPLDQV